MATLSANAVTEASIAYVMMNESILLEARIDYLKANTKPLSTDHDPLAKHKETPDIIQHFADNADPTKNKQHTQYIVGLYRNKAIRQEDASAIKETLTNFEKHKGKLDSNDRQLTAANYPRISDLDAKLKPHLGTASTNKEATQQLKDNTNIPGKHPLVYEDDKIKIYHNADKETAKKMYASTKDKKPGAFPSEWCTSRDTEHNMFDDYLKSEGGKYHVIHRKSDGKIFQIHPQSNQFHDANNDDISAEDFKSIAPSFHKAIEKHPEIIG